ncbi:virion structural protein [Acaryochloris phage A-HIS2]|nr:virion structural protein [Acaryochloris phage A-HIS2]
MPILGLTVNPGNSQTLVGIRAATPETAELTIEFDTASIVQPPGTTDPPAVTPTGNSQDPLDPAFDHTTLPRVTVFPQSTLTINVCDTTLTINGVDYSHLFSSGDFSYFLSGAITGGIQLVSSTFGTSTVIGGIPQANSSFTGFPTVKIGDSIRWSQSFQGVDLTVCDCSVTEIPKIETDANGVSSMVIKVGGIFTLLANRNTRQPSLFCGDPPRTANEAASAYAAVNGFGNTAFPVGHFLRESINQFTTEDAYGFLQALYDPRNIDVREDPTGNVRAFFRPAFSNTTLADLSHEEVIELSTNTGNITPLSRLTVFNRYRRDDGFPPRRETYRTYSDNFDGTPGATPTFNGSPVPVWFLGGSTYTDHIVDYIGETEVFHEEKTYGYIPTDTTIFQADLNDRCNPATIASQFALITTRTRASFYVADPDTELFPIWKTQNFLAGYYVTNTEADRGSGPESAYIIAQGNISNVVEEFTNVIQEDAGVCPQNQISLILARTLSEFGRDQAGIYRILRSETDSWTSQGAQIPVQPVGDFFGTGQTWIRNSTRGSYSEDLGRWNATPVPQTNEAPPNTTYIQPITVDIAVSGEVNLPSLEAIYGDREGIPVQGRFCYTIEDCETKAERILREAAGLHEGRLLVVPYSFPYNPGHSIRFTDKTGETNDYIVFAVEVNQTREIATKTVLLMKTFD